MMPPLPQPPRTDLERAVLDRFQQQLPLSPTPFADMAEQLGTDEQTILDTLARLQAEGAISRVGPVFRPHSIGASTLAAIAVPPERLEAVAAIVNGFEEVNHNYEREHRLNLWFVVTAEDGVAVQRVLHAISTRTGLPVLDLPMLADFHINLGFSLQWN